MNANIWNLTIVAAADRAPTAAGKKSAAKARRCLPRPRPTVGRVPQPTSAAICNHRQMADDACAYIEAYVREHGPCCAAAIARAMKRHPHSIVKFTNRLAAKGVLVKSGRGNQTLFRAKEGTHA